MQSKSLMGLGIDIVEVKRIKKAIEKNKHFQSRVYTVEEVAYCESKKRGIYQSFAGIYAAKEAFVKALGTGFRKGKWHEIQVIHSSVGAPELEISGRFADIMLAKGYTKALLTISHCKEYACSQVILM